VGGGVERLSLKEKANFDCIFWDQSCGVYQSRPLQCRTFPFWPSILESRSAWLETARSCPGIGKGEQHSLELIQEALAQQLAEPPLVRTRWGSI
jgi:Fe-S-cluster containining protein